MKKAISIIVALLFVISLTGLCFAAEKTNIKPAMKEKAAEKEAPVKIKHVGGEVTAVDSKAGTLSVKGKKEEVSLTTDSKTIIRSGKEKKTLADVKVGDKVRVKYTVVDGKNVAKSIAIGMMKPAEKPVKPAEKTKGAK